MKILPIVVMILLLASIFLGLLAGVLLGHRAGSRSQPPPWAIRH